MILPMFVVSAVDVVFLAAAIMHKRGGCIVDCYPVGVLPTAARNILRP